jgi:hypothetical protein
VVIFKAGSGNDDLVAGLHDSTCLRHALPRDDIEIDTEVRERRARVRGCRAGPDNDSHGLGDPPQARTSSSPNSASAMFLRTCFHLRWVVLTLSCDQSTETGPSRLHR